MKLGRYELISKLGSGGMADVYKAKRTGPGGFEQIVAAALVPQVTVGIHHRGVPGAAPA